MSVDTDGIYDRCAECGARAQTVGAIIGLDDCLAEINNALNYWYPLESEGCAKTECDARHVRLFQFRDRLAERLKQNAESETLT